MVARRVLPLLGICLSTICAPGGSSAETAKYSYDALGCMNKNCHATGTGSLGTYTLDRAGNRTAFNTYRTDITLATGAYITSGDGRFVLAMRADGDLILYENYGAHTTLWESATAGSGATTAVFQSDGNLVLYNSSGAAVWATNSSGYFCATLKIQNDGNMVIADWTGVVVWATNTGGH